MIRRIVLVGFQLFLPRAHYSLPSPSTSSAQKLFHHTKYPDFDPSSLATISTWEAETWYALLCRIDLEPQKVSARTDSIYEIRIVLWESWSAVPKFRLSFTESLNFSAFQAFGNEISLKFPPKFP